MNSIHRNQPEDNHQDLRGLPAVEKIKAVVDKAKSCFFCTMVAVWGSNGVRPMNVRHVDEEGNLWFLSAEDSHKNEELARDGTVKLFFQSSPHSGFLFLTGHATISRDKEKIEELWQPILRTWFTEGVNDPRITVIKVAPSEGYYWDNKHGNAIAGVKMIVGAMTGKTLDDSIEGRIAV